MNDRKTASGFDVRQCVFRRKELLLSLKNFVVARFAFLVTVCSHRDRIATCADGLGLLCALLLQSAVGDERVGDLAERNEGYLLIL